MIVIDGMYRKVMGSDEINERFACLLDKEVQLISDDDDDEVVYLHFPGDGKYIKMENPEFLQLGDNLILAYSLGINHIIELPKRIDEE